LSRCVLRLLHLLHRSAGGGPAAPVLLLLLVRT
jgi:hypothetical protein